MFDGISLQPVVHVNNGLKLPPIIRAQAGEIRRIDQDEQVGVIAGGPVHGAFGERPTITRQLLLAAGGRKLLQRSAVRAEGGRSIVELEPQLNLVQLAIIAVRVKLVRTIDGGLLYV